MPKILLDTNFLLIPAQFHVDVFEALKEHGDEFIILSPVAVELEKLSRSAGKKGAEARVALQLIEKKHIKTVAVIEKNTDTALMKYAEKYSYAVATNDKKLIKRLRSKGIKIIRLRQKKFLIME
jgi:hypothetical protein